MSVRQEYVRQVVTDFAVEYGLTMGQAIRLLDNVEDIDYIRSIAGIDDLLWTLEEDG